MAAELALTSDGGVKKTVIAAAPSEHTESPEAGDDVNVHYTGRLLDGTVFDSSVERGTPFNFKIGRGEKTKHRETQRERRETTGMKAYRREKRQAERRLE